MSKTHIHKRVFLSVSSFIVIYQASCNFKSVVKLQFCKSPNHVFSTCLWCFSNGMTLEPALSGALWWELSNCQRDQKTAWPKMIAHKMPQALLVLSHVQSAIRFVSFLHFCFQLSWSIIVEKVGCLASNLNRKDWWEFIWNAWEPMSTKIRSCRCGNRSLLSLQRFLWTLDYANTYENSKTCANEKLLQSEESISIYKWFF